jgi:hypothetical protein
MRALPVSCLGIVHTLVSPQIEIQGEGREKMARGLCHLLDLPPDTLSQVPYI